MGKTSKQHLLLSKIPPPRWPRPDGAIASEYLGRGPQAELAAHIDQAEREQKRAQSHRWQQTKAEILAERKIEATQSRALGP